jgi:hypothetical protein
VGEQWNAPAIVAVGLGFGFSWISIFAELRRKFLGKMGGLVVVFETSRR